MTPPLPLSTNLQRLETDALELLRQALARHQSRIALASSFSLEDVVVIDLLVRVRPEVRVFAIDTGRLPEETLLCADAVRNRFGIAIDWYFPERFEVESLVRAKGTYSFLDGLAARHECCQIRKLEPLSRALSGLTGWITGLRREQYVSRSGLETVEIDALHGGIAKYNPLAAWTAADVAEYTAARRLPVHRLYAQGYRSIGCAPCTRAVQPGEDDRAGRWWWENPEHKECGLHAKY